MFSRQTNGEMALAVDSRQVVRGAWGAHLVYRSKSRLIEHGVRSGLCPINSQNCTAITTDDMTAYGAKERKGHFINQKPLAGITRPRNQATFRLHFCLPFTENPISHS